jgi:hypothetical protein
MKKEATQNAGAQKQRSLMEKRQPQNAKKIGASKAYMTKKQRPIMKKRHPQSERDSKTKTSKEKRGTPKVHRTKHKSKTHKGDLAN